MLVKKNLYVFARQEEQEVVACLDLDTGKQIWRDAYDAPYTMNPVARAHGKGPKSTPAYHAGRLFTLGISGILSSYDAQSGKLRWRREFSPDFKTTSPLYGMATSPVIEAKLLITFVGGNDSGALMAFDADAGKTVWSWSGDGPSYSSPIVVDVAGTRQVVTQSQKNVIGVSAVDGKLLWSIPFTTPYVQNIITPILFRDLLIFSGLEKGVMAVRVAKNAGEWKTERIWENPEVGFYMSDPVLNGSRLCGMSHKNRGQYVALDAATGKTLWTTAGREGENAAILTAADKLFLLTNEGALTVARASSTGFEAIRKYTVAQSPTWAHPVIAGKSILIKDLETLALWSFE